MLFSQFNTIFISQFILIILQLITINQSFNIVIIMLYNISFCVHKIDVLSKNIFFSNTIECE